MPDIDPSQPPDPRSFRPLPAINTAGMAPSRVAQDAQDQDAQDQDTRFTPRPFPPSTFIPNTARDPSLMGKDHWPITAATMYPGQGPTDNVPSPPEAYSVLGQYGSQLSRIASPGVSQLASSVSGAAMGFAPILDMLSKGAFTQNYNASSLGALKIKQQRMLIAAEEMQQRHAQELMGYGEIIAATKAGLDPHEAERRLHDLAVQNQHQWLAAAIEKGGLAGAINFLNYEDTLFRNLWAGTTSLKKATAADEDEETLSQFGEDRKTALGGGGGGGIFGPAPDTAHAAAKQPEGIDTPAGDNFAGISKKLRLTPQEQEAVREQVTTGSPSASMAALEKGRDTAGKEFLKNKIAQGVDATQHAIDKVIDDPNMNIGDKIKKIAEYSPGQASQLVGLRRYQLDPKEPGVANRSLMTNRAIRLFGKDFDQQNYAAIQEFKKDRPERRLVTRAGSMGSAALGLWGALSQTKEGELIPLRAFENYVSRNLDPNETAYYKVFDGLMDFAQHFQAIETGTGTPRVTPTMEWLKHISVDSSPAQIRAAMMQNMIAAFQVINTEEGTWEKLLKRNDELMPGITPHDYKMLRDLVRADTDTGVVPSDSVREVQAVGRDPSEASKPFRDNPPPLTMKQIREDYLPRIAEWENSPDPEKRKAAQAARRRVGRVVEIERFVPEVDDANANVR